MPVPKGLPALRAHHRRAHRPSSAPQVLYLAFFRLTHTKAREYFNFHEVTTKGNHRLPDLLSRWTQATSIVVISQGNKPAAAAAAVSF